MNMRNVNIVARYESKLLRRDIVFLGFVVIALVGISLWQMIKQGRVNVFWYKVALPSSFPFFSMYYYNLVQVLIALFVCMEVVYRERKKDAMEVFLCRPFRNNQTVFPVTPCSSLPVSFSFQHCDWNRSGTFL